jgi:hypothetical protein
MEQVKFDNKIAIVLNDKIVAVVDKNGNALSIREDGWATVDLMDATMAVCRRQGWPEKAIKELMHGVMHGKNVGLVGQILPWEEIK